MDFVNSRIEGRLLCKNCKVVENPFEKCLGLLANVGSCCILFRTRFGIHTFFMKKPIDVLVLDSDRRVKCIKENMSPNKLFFWKPLYNIVIELPAGTVKRTKIKPGNILDFSA